MAGGVTDTAAWASEATALAARLGSGPDGLTTGSARDRLAETGPNSVDEAARMGALRLLLRQFESPIVLILLVAASISLVLQQWVDAGIVVAIVLGSAAMNTLHHSHRPVMVVPHRVG